MDIELWEDASGKSPISIFIKALPNKTNKKVFWCLDLLQKHGYDLCKTKHMEKLTGYNLYELRINVYGSYRILFIINQNKAILLHMFQKKTNRTPKREIKTALNKIT